MRNSFRGAPEAQDRPDDNRITGKQIQVAFFTIMLMALCYGITKTFIIPEIKIWQYAAIDVMGSGSYRLVKYMLKTK